MFWLQMNLQQPAINAMVSEVIELLLRHYGVFHVVAKIIRELKSQMIPYKVLFETKRTLLILIFSLINFLIYHQIFSWHLKLHIFVENH